MKRLGVRSPGLVGISATDIPDACYANPAFVADLQNSNAMLTQHVQDLVDQAVAVGQCEAGDESACFEQIYRPLFDTLVVKLMQAHGCTPVSGESSKACSSYESKVEAQKGLRALNWYEGDIDGVWGPASAAALAASGYTFQQIVPGCQGPAPAVVKASTPGTTPGTGADQGDTTGPGGFQQVNYGDSPASKATSPWVWVGVGAVAVVGLGWLVGSKMGSDSKPTR